MRVDLALELQISVLGHVRLFPFVLHLVVRHDGIVDHVDDAVYGYLYHHGYAEEQNEICVRMTYKEGLQQGRENHECAVQEHCADFGIALVSCRDRPYEKYIHADEDDECERIRHYHAYHVEDLVLLQV